MKVDKDKIQIKKRLLIVVPIHGNDYSRVKKIIDNFHIYCHGNVLFYINNITDSKLLELESANVIIEKDKNVLKIAQIRKNLIKLIQSYPPLYLFSHVLMMDEDDTFDYDKAVEIVSKYNSDSIICNFWIKNEKSRKRIAEYADYNNELEVSDRRFLGFILSTHAHAFVNNQRIITKTSVIKSIVLPTGDYSFSYGDDTLISSLIFKNSKTIRFTRTRLFTYIKSGKNITSTSSITDQMLFIEDWMKSFELCKKCCNETAVSLIYSMRFRELGESVLSRINKFDPTGARL